MQKINNSSNNSIQKVFMASLMKGGFPQVEMTCDFTVKSLQIISPQNNIYFDINNFATIVE